MTEVEAFSAPRTVTIRDAMATINASGMQMLLLVDETGRFQRTVTDGDLRRLLLAGSEMGDSLETLPALESVTAPEEVTRKAALGLMDAHEFVEEAFRTNWIAPLGPHVDGFERELAALPASAMPRRSARAPPPSTSACCCWACSRATRCSARR
jgi:hypothetical protein